MTEICIELYVPGDDYCLDYRNRCETRALELGWPIPHSAGTCFASERIIVDLQWTINSRDGLADVISTLRQEFDVRDVLLYD